jgi:hypothetical protein
MKRGWNKRGQFYLLAAIIIVALIMGVAIVTNTARKEGIDKTEIYNLFAKVNINEQDMIDYNTINGYDEEELTNILDIFTGTYSSSKKVYIIIDKLGERSYYVYEGGTIGESEDEEIEDYNYGTGQNFYVMIIQEKNGEQYIIKA